VSGEADQQVQGKMRLKGVFLVTKKCIMGTGELRSKDIIIASLYYFVVSITMRKVDIVKKVDDTAENLEICKKYCGSCPTFKGSRLSESPPNALFCARGKSSDSSKVKTISCFCPACELFTKYELIIGHFCTK
jgi:hypothetical protein